jgi:hypothetical protein
LDGAHQPGKLGGKGNPEVGLAGTGTAWNGHGLSDEDGASGYLRAKGSRAGREGVSKLVRLGARDAGQNRRTARADRPIFPDGRGSFGGDPSLLDSRSDDRLHGWAQKRVLGPEAGGSQVPDGGIHYRPV